MTRMMIIHVFKRRRKTRGTTKSKKNTQIKHVYQFGFRLDCGLNPLSEKPAMMMMIIQAEKTFKNYTNDSRRCTGKHSITSLMILSLKRWQICISPSWQISRNGQRQIHFGWWLVKAVQISSSTSTMSDRECCQKLKVWKRWLMQIFSAVTLIMMMMMMMMKVKIGRRVRQQQSRDRDLNPIQSPSHISLS